MNKKEAFREIAANRLESLAIAKQCSKIEDQYLELMRSCEYIKTINDDAKIILQQKSEAKMQEYREEIMSLEKKSNGLFENLDLFMNPESNEHNIVVPEHPASYNNYLLALESQLPERTVIKECSAADFSVDKGLYSIVKNNKEEYEVVTLKNNGDINVISKKTYVHAFQARNLLEHYFEKLKVSGKVSKPLYVRGDTLLTLSAFAKIGDKEHFEIIKSRSSFEIVTKNETIESASNQAYEMLKNGVVEFFNCGKYKDYLKTASHFHNYSFNNTILIAMQNPAATRCAGKTTWQALGRYIKSGAKGIKVFAPNIRKMTDDEKKKLKIPKEKDEKVLTSFRIANVFDISDTDGKPLPTICDKLTGEVKDYNKILKALENVSGIKIQFSNIPGEANGYFNVNRKEIVIQEGMSELQSIKTAIHETAHSLFDNPSSVLYIEDSSRMDKEVRAESVAFMVSNRLGFDTSEYSFPYVASWSVSKTTEELEKNMKSVMRGMSTIVEGINKELHLFETNEDLKNIINKNEQQLQNVSAVQMKL